VRQLVIDNPVIDSAFLEPAKHFQFTDDGITDEIVESRRPSAYFIPVAQPKKKGRQLELGTEWTDDRRRENDYINEVRAAIGDWRKRDYPGVTRTTRRLLEYWQRRDRDCPSNLRALSYYPDAPVGCKPAASLPEPPVCRTHCERRSSAATSSESVR